MRTLTRLTIVLSFVATSVIACAQGGAAGYGQQSGGFGGGGFGGGFGGAAGPGMAPSAPMDKAKRPEQEDSYGLWEERTAILTPGDRVEFKLKMKAGETLLASATSDAFDPALQIEDDKQKVLARNDDREEGDQAPFVAYRFPADGDYLLKVISYRAVSGGKFTAKMRVFRAYEARLGKHQQEIVPSEAKRSPSVALFRLEAKKDHIYDLGDVLAVLPTYRSECGFASIVGPTGVAAKDYEMIPTGDGTPLFKAAADGDYYLEYLCSSAKHFVTEFRDVAIVSSKATAEEKLQFTPRELKVVEFPIVPGQIVRTTVEGSALTTISAPSGEENRSSAPDPAWGNNPTWAWFKVNRDVDSDIVRIFHGKGTARIAIRSTTPGPQTIVVKNQESLPDWAEGQSRKGSVEIGDVRFFLLKASKSELMRVDARAKQFQPRLDIFRLNGELANSLCDRQNHDANDDLYFPEEGTFLVRLSCDGYGGSGEYELNRDTLEPQPYTLGAVQTLKLDGINFGLYEVMLEAGKRYELMTDQPQRPLRADLLDDDGQFVTSQTIRFEQVEVQYFVAQRTGRHRLWLRGGPGERQFRFQLHVPPKIGG